MWCLDKRKRWARMAIATARAEFPEFTVLHAMSVLSLRNPDIASNGAIDTGGGCAPLEDRGDNVTEKLQTLANALAVDPERLTEQHHAVKTISKAKLDANGCFQREAWRSATHTS